MNLIKILEQHSVWLKSKGKEGKRVYLRKADLKEANLRGANLKGAYLAGANLAGAYRPEGLKGYKIDEDGYII